MQIQIETQPYASIEADALVTYVFDQDDKFDGVLAEINVAMNGRLERPCHQRRTDRQVAGNRCSSIFPKGLRRSGCCWSARASRRNSASATCARLPERRCVI